MIIVGLAGGFDGEVFGTNRAGGVAGEVKEGAGGAAGTVGTGAGVDGGGVGVVGTGAGVEATGGGVVGATGADGVQPTTATIITILERIPKDLANLFFINVPP